MIYDISALAIVIFSVFVALVLGMSIWFARKGSSSKSYFAAGGEINWAVNGIAFAGDYLSAASFLGICAMIAFNGFDGFLYSIGYLAGWIVAMFVVAEPMKRLGKFTFADALDSKFNSKGIQLMAGISTLVVSIFYLIPQMVGAGTLVKPLLGLPHWAGVVIVGVVVITIVSTAGMKSTTYVQFLKGGLLIVFSTILVGIVLFKGFQTRPYEDYHTFRELTPVWEQTEIETYLAGVEEEGFKVQIQYSDDKRHLVKIEEASESGEKHSRWWEMKKLEDGSFKLLETLSITKRISGQETSTLYNGLPKDKNGFFQVGHAQTLIMKGKPVEKTGPLNVINIFGVVNESTIIRWKKVSFTEGNEEISCWLQTPTAGSDVLRPGLKFKVDSIMPEDETPRAASKAARKTAANRADFFSLMLALFFGTAALPHVLIRYYTVPTPSAARKSTIVAIASIGFFYMLTLYMGLGGMFSGVLNVDDVNMAAPLLAKMYGNTIFAIISAIAFATVLGTVSGLITASSGAVAHDLADQFFDVKMSDKKKVWIGKISAVVVGLIAIALGILFEGMNVAFLVGWAFAVAASANLPSILMLLFWKKTTAAGIVASITTGIISAMGIILISPNMFEKYGVAKELAPLGINNPAIISIPLSFLALIIASLLSQKKTKEA